MRRVVIISIAAVSLLLAVSVGAFVYQEMNDAQGQDDNSDHTTAYYDNFVYPGMPAVILSSGNQYKAIESALVGYTDAIKVTTDAADVTAGAIVYICDDWVVSYGTLAATAVINGSSEGGYAVISSNVAAIKAVESSVSWNDSAIFNCYCQIGGITRCFGIECESYQTAVQACYNWAAESLNLGKPLV